jgi:cytochrome P450
MMAVPDVTKAPGYAEFFTNFDHYAVPVGADGTTYQFYEAFRDFTVENDTRIGWCESYGGCWVVAGYDEAKEVISNPTAFSSSQTTLPNYVQPSGNPLIIGQMDEPEHTKYRQLVQGAFSPRRANELSELIRRTVNDLIDGFIEKGQAELVRDLTNEVPGRLIAIIIGVPPEQGDMYRRWTDAMARYHMDPEGASVQLREMGDYFRSVLEERRNTPGGDDIVSTIMQTEINGERMSDEEMLDLFFILLLAGIDNTTKLLGTVGWRLAWDVELRRRLLDDPKLLPSAVEEFLRYYNTALMTRVCAEPTTVGGVDIEEGQVVLLVNTVTNRDPRQFDNPDAFVPDRAPNRHLGLGLGIHRCLGAHLLKVETRVIMEELLRRIPDFALDPEDAPRWHGGVVNGMEYVPVVFPPGGGRREAQAAH